jgi:hypothetical protein
LHPKLITLGNIEDYLTYQLGVRTFLKTIKGFNIMEVLLKCILLCTYNLILRCVVLERIQCAHKKGPCMFFRTIINVSCFVLQSSCFRY